MKRPRLRNGILVSAASDGYVVYDVTQNMFHELNGTAALLLELCNGERETSEIADIAAEYLPDNAEVTVLAWLVEAEQAGLVVDGDSPLGVESDNLTSDRLGQLAASLRDEGYVHAAYVCQEHVVSQNPNDHRQLRELGELAHILGRRDACRAAFEKYLNVLPDDAEIQHLLTSLRDEQPPERVPDACIEQLYERFATFYESNMCGELGYEGPKHLNHVIHDVLQDRRDLRVLDLGCGTGLAGLEVRQRARRLVGVDLSRDMIAHARDRGIYDELYVSEVTQWLRESDEEFDLVMACDTFIYFGDLAPVLTLAGQRLDTTGAVAFSVERAESGDHHLTDNGRYVHHRSHLESAARSAGMKISSEREEFIRMEYGVPVNGIYVALSTDTSVAVPGFH